MSFASKIFLGFIIAASLPMAWLSMRTLKTHDVWRTAYTTAQQLVAEEQLTGRLRADSEDETALADRKMVFPGSAEPEPGLRQLKQDLQQVMATRGRAWYGCTPTAVDADTLSITVQTGPAPDPHQLTAGMTVFLFDERDVRLTAGNPQRGEFLGEFNITDVNGQIIIFQPAMSLTQREKDRLVASQQSETTWVIHDVMPADRHGKFAGLTNDELQAFLPDQIVSQAVRDEYLKDGKPAEPGDPAENVVDGNYQRPLKDFMVRFREIQRLRPLADDRIEALTKDNELLQQDLANAQEQQEFRTKKITEVGEELARTKAELKLVRRHHDAVEAKLADVRARVDRAMVETKRLAAEWTLLQVEAARAIDAATASTQQASLPRSRSAP